MYNFCEKCKVNVDNIHQTCPLCGAYIKKDEEKTISDKPSAIYYGYPKINTESVIKNLMLKIIIYVSIISTACVILIDLILSGKIDWSFHVAVGWLVFWFSLGRTIFFNLELRRQVVWDCIFASFLVYYAQYYVGIGENWALEVGLPLIDISCLILLGSTMVIKYKQWERYCLPISIICLFSMVPIIVYGILNRQVLVLHVICAGAGVVLLLGMMLLGNKKYFMELKKKFHI